MPYKESERAREQRLQHNREYYAENKERLNARAREYRAKNRDLINARVREHRARNKGPRREYRAKNRDWLNADAYEYRTNLRAQFREIYGKECACGVDDVRFLTVGHKLNDGKQDRGENGGMWGMLIYAIKHPDRTRYETQCFNCQRIARLNHLATKPCAGNSVKANKHRADARKHRAGIRHRLFEIYGPLCACCGVSDQRVLQLAHKNNDGARDRRENGRYGSFMHAVEQPDHSKFEILCANCNEGAAHNGDVCPHKTRGSPTLSAAL